MVSRRGYSLRHFVDLVSSNAARLMGLYPRKGAIAPGSDADLCVLDPALRRRVRKEDLHETDYSPWEGHEVTAWPSMMRLTTPSVRSRYSPAGKRSSSGRPLPARPLRPEAW